MIQNYFEIETNFNELRDEKEPNFVCVCARQMDDNLNFCEFKTLKISFKYSKDHFELLLTDF